MKLECYIARDLLPSYLEGLTEEQTSLDMKEHLEGCAECRKHQEQMQQEIKIVDLPEAQIDYLKGIKKQLSRKSLLGIGILVAAVLVNLIMSFFIAAGVDAYQLMIILPFLLFLSYYLMGDVLAKEEKTGQKYQFLLGIPVLALVIANVLMIGIFEGLKKGQLLFALNAEQLGPVMFYSLISLILIILAFSGWALVLGLKQSYKYFLVVCNGLSAISMLFAQISLLRTLTSVESFFGAIFASNLVYLEGVLSIFIISALLKKNMQDKR